MGNFIGINKNTITQSMLLRLQVGDAIREGKAVTILDNWCNKTEDISLLYPSNKHLSAKVRAFIDLAVEHFKPLEKGLKFCDLMAK